MVQSFLMGEKNKIIIWVSVNILLFILPLCVVVLSNSDDAVFVSTFSGANSTMVHSEMVYFGNIWGYMISQLYKLAPTIEWYSWIQHILLIISFNVYWWFVSARIEDKVLKTFAAVVLSLLCIYSILAMQYTATAFYISLASLFIIYDVITLRRLVLSSILFFIATQYRTSGALMPIMIIAPIFILSNYHGIKALKCKGAFLLLLSVITAFTTLLNYQSEHKDKEWSHYTEFTYSRAYINDNPSCLKGFDVIKDSIKKKEYELICNYFLYDGNIISIEELRQIGSYLKGFVLENVKTNLHPYFRFYWRMGILFLLLVIIMGLLKTNKRKCMYFLFISTILLFIAANMYMMSRSIAKERVLLPAYLSLCVATILITKDYCIGFKFQKCVAYSVILLLGTVFIIKDIDRYRYNKGVAELAKETETILQQNSYPRVHIHIGVAVDVDAFNMSNNIIYKSMVDCGWTINSPYVREFYKGFTSYIDDNLPMLINKRNMNRIEDIVYILKHHYGIESHYLINDESKNYYIIQLVRD